MEFCAHINDYYEEQSVKQHCENTAKIASQLLNCIDLENIAFIAGLFHDMGKSTKEFDDYIRESHSGVKTKRGSIIHSFSGVSYFLKKYHDSDSIGCPQFTSEILAYAIGSHHGAFDIFDENHASGFRHRLEKQPEYDWRAIKNYSDSVCNDKTAEKLFDKSVDEIIPIINTINELTKSYGESEFYCGLFARLISSAVIDADRMDTASFMSRDAERTKTKTASAEIWQSCISQLMKYIDSIPNDRQISKARREFSDICGEAGSGKTGIYRLNLPTGAGKTLSGLRFAVNHALNNNLDRIIFVSPLLSILEQNAKVIRDALDNNSIILEHHSNVILDNKAKSELDKYDILTENWNSPIIITTLVQLLNTMFKSQTSAVRRFHALCGSVIVIDEVQTVPTNMLTLFDLTINFLVKICHSTVVLCSATQPEFTETKHKLCSDITDIVPRNILAKYDNVFKRNRITDRGEYRLEDIPSLVNELIRKYKSVLVVCNKKSESERLYSIISDNNAFSVFHLSASMCIQHRRDVLEQIKNALNGENKVICISTQVIEAGVDISFDSVIRFSAGMDSVVQAAGRCNRNGESSSDSPVYIVRCTDENLDRLREIKAAQASTLNLLEIFRNNPAQFDNDLSSDKAIAAYYRSLYNNMDIDSQDYPIKDHPTMYELLSINSRYAGENKDAEKYILHQAFKSAGDFFEVFDSSQKTVIVPYGNGREIIAELYTERAMNDFDYLKKLLNDAKQYSISIFDYQLKQLEDLRGIHSACDGRVLTLDEDFYSNKTGFIFSKSMEEDELCDTQIL